jgi:hypothetical protein
LINQRDRVVAKSALLDSVWGHRFVTESALTTQIKELRRAVGDSGRFQRVVTTVHSRGYMFIASVEEDTLPLQPAHGHNPILAVLPFANLTADPGQAHVAEGLTHDIIPATRSSQSKHRWPTGADSGDEAAYAGRAASKTSVGIPVILVSVDARAACSGTHTGRRFPRRVTRGLVLTP